MPGDLDPKIFGQPACETPAERRGSVQSVVQGVGAENLIRPV
jgi:hypothetical protein